MVGLLASNVQAASLWVKAGNVEQSMFADKVARNIGDILTVIVDESVNSGATTEITTKRARFINSHCRSAKATRTRARSPNR